MPLSKRWLNYKDDPLYKAWRGRGLSNEAFNSYALADAAEIISNLYSTASGGQLGAAKRILQDFKPQAIMKMLKDLGVLVQAAEDGSPVFADEPEPVAPREAKADARQETPEERAAEAELVKHPSTFVDSLGNSCKSCAHYKPEAQGRGQCLSPYVKQPVASSWYCKHWKAVMANKDGSRVQSSLLFIQASGEAHEWGCLMLNFPKDFASKVIAWGKENVPDDVLYQDSEEPTSYGRETQVHTTCVYGLNPGVTIEELKNILEEPTL